MKATIILMAMIAAFGITSGCSTKYVGSDTPIIGDPSVTTMYDLNKATQSLMAKMLGHPHFAQNYEAAKKAMHGKRPTVVLMGVSYLPKDPNVHDPNVQQRLDTVGEDIRIAMFNDGRVDVKIDEASIAIANRIISGPDVGIENISLAQTMGDQDPPDFAILGDFRHFEDVGGYHTYRLRIAIHNLRDGGKIIWEGVQTYIKL